ncbi:MAG: hypothetical protein LBN10_01645 [Propionibacteriaceae bacterium]|nr:hypothetical protein [Propionibacteriaceae bacterium]
MALFDRFKKKTTPSVAAGDKGATNEIGNRTLKEDLANTALSTLHQGEDYQELANTLVEFGYVFLMENHGVEALFRVTTDKAICYFAAQGESIQRLALDEDMFHFISDTFMDMHG